MTGKWLAICALLTGVMVMAVHTWTDYRAEVLRPVVVLADEDALAWFLGATGEDLELVDTLVIGVGHFLEGSTPSRDPRGQVSYQYASPQLVGRAISKGHEHNMSVLCHLNLDRSGLGVARTVNLIYELQDRTGLDGAILETRRRF